MGKAARFKQKKGYKMDSKFVVKLTLGVQNLEPIRSMELNAQGQNRMIMAGEQHFFAEHRDPAAAVAAALMNLVGYAERLYGPIVLTGDLPPSDQPAPKLVVVPGEDGE